MAGFILRTVRRAVMVIYGTERAQCARIVAYACNMESRANMWRQAANAIREQALSCIGRGVVMSCMTIVCRR